MNFDLDFRKVGGRTLSEFARENDISGARDQLPMPWHFRQCILANSMRGAGEPIWDHGDDELGGQVALIMKEDESGRGLYLKLAHRLAVAGS
jgi:hypothetical protein